jgi:hypothetical protein
MNLINKIRVELIKIENELNMLISVFLMYSKILIIIRFDLINKTKHKQFKIKILNKMQFECLARDPIWLECSPIEY